MRYVPDVIYNNIVVPRTARKLDFSMDFRDKERLPNQRDYYFRQEAESVRKVIEKISDHFVEQSDA